MKRVLIFPFFIIFTQSAFALDCGITADGCPPGCGYNDTDYCFECSVGTYSAGGYDVCTECNKPDGATFLDGYTGRTGENTCPWELNCKKDQYVDSADIFKGCISCGPGYNSKLETGYTITHPGDVEGFDEFVQAVNLHSKEMVCDPIAIELRLEPNTGFAGNRWPGMPSGYETRTAYYKEGFGFSNSPDENAEWNENGLDSTLLQPSYVMKEFFGYSTDADDCGERAKLMFKKNGDVVGEPAFTSDTTLYACWKNTNMAVVYAITDSDGFSVGCTQDDVTGKWMECKSSISSVSECIPTDKECLVRDYGDYGDYTVPSGQNFAYYSCEYLIMGGGGETGDCGKLMVRDMVPAMSAFMKLTPVFAGCKPGYYCEGGKAIACPMGTTSDIESSSITDCYMGGGENGVKFCDEKGCFTLPSGVVIPYNPD